MGRGRARKPGIVGGGISTNGCGMVYGELVRRVERAN